MTSSRAGKKRSHAEIAQQKRFFNIIGISLMVVGLVLIVASFSARAVPAKAVWTNEQAVAHQKASNKYHNDQFDESISKVELKASREEFEAINQKLKNAKFKRDGLPIVLRWIGIVSAGLGYVITLLVRSNED